MRNFNIFFMILILWPVASYGADVALVSGATVTDCKQIGNSSVFLNDPNDYSTLKAGYVLIPGGCKSLPAPIKYLKVSNGEIVEMSPAEKIAVDSSEASAVTSQLRTLAKEHLTADTPDAKAVRNAVRILMQSIVETRQKVNELVDAQNIAHGTSISKLSNRTWTQLMNATRNQIDNETDPTN